MVLGLDVSDDRRCCRERDGDPPGQLEPLLLQIGGHARYAGRYRDGGLCEDFRRDH